jgi:hypothetical protein
MKVKSLSMLAFAFLFVCGVFAEVSPLYALLGPLWRSVWRGVA